MVVVTGAAGFIGARAVERLTSRGADVVSVDSLSAFDNRPEHSGVNFGQRIDVAHIGGWLASGPSVQAILHLGACTDTRETDRAYLDRVNLAASQDLCDLERRLRNFERRTRF